MKPIKSINRTTFINICSTAILQGIAFLTTPVFSRMLGADQYGIYAVFNSWVLIFACFMGLGSHAAIGTGLYHFKDRYLSFRSSILLYGTVTSAVIILGCAAFVTPLSSLLHMSILEVFLLMITAAAHYIVTFFQNTCVYEKRAGDNLLVSLLLSLGTVLLSVFLISKSEPQLRYFGRILGVVIPYAVVSTVLWFMIMRQGKPSSDAAFIRFAFAVGFPIIFHSLAQNILSQSDRVMMQAWKIPNSEIGIYSLIYSLSMVLTTLLNALNTSWCPFFYEYLSKDRWDIIEEKTKHYVELFTVLACGFLLVSREVMYFMGDSSYWSGAALIPVLVGAVYCMFLYQYPVNFEFFHRKTNYVAIGTIGSGIVNIILNALMIPVWGMYGAALATMLSYAVLFFFHFMLVSHMKDVQYKVRTVLFLPGVAAVAVFSVLFFALSEFWWIRWLAGAALGIGELRAIVKRKVIF